MPDAPPALECRQLVKTFVRPAVDRLDLTVRPGEFYAEDKYDHIYVDCPTKDMGDMVMNIPVHEQRVCHRLFRPADLRDWGVTGTPDTGRRGQRDRK